MAYLGNSPVLSQQEYRNIDNISGSFNGVTTSFPLLVNGVAPVPAPQSSNQCLISVNGVVQKPDDTGASGFRLSGGNIVFSAAPTGGQSFFGVILAGADYVYSGANFPDGTVSAPSITFAQDLDTGFYRSGAGEVKFTANGANAVTLSANNLTAPSFIPTSSTVPTNGTYLSAANQLSFATSTTERLRIDSAGQIEAVSLGTAAAPTYSFTTDPNTGIYSPGADQVAISTNGSQRLLINSGGITSANGGVFQGDVSSYATNGLALTFNSNNSEIRACRSGGNYTNMLFYTQGANSSGAQQERMRLTSEGLLGLGTSNPVDNFAVGDGTVSTDSVIRINGGSNTGKGSGIRLMKANTAYGYIGSYSWLTGLGTSNNLAISTTGGADLIVDTTGKVGIGTTSPSSIATGYGVVHVSGTNGGGVVLGASGYIAGGTSGVEFGTTTNNPVTFFANNSEKARLTSDGKLLVGTSSSSAGTRAVFQGQSSGAGAGAQIHLQRDQAAASIGSGQPLGIINFADNSAGVFATISAESDATPGTNDYPGRIVFSTTADGASSPTERMRITNAGGVRLPDVYNATIALSANVFIDTDGTLKRATSSIKYKTDVETLQDSYADAILNCRPVWYRSTNESDNPTWGWWGFIAEEVAEIDPRLVQWKTVEQVINEDGSRDTVPLETPEPENVAYDRFVPHLLNLIKRQGEAIAELQAEVAALKAQ